MARPPSQGVGPWTVAELEPHLVNEIFRQIETEINRLRGLGATVSIQIGVHTHEAAASGGKLDHGAALTGLGDNDHPQYLLASAVTTDEAVQEATSHDRISDQVMVAETLTLTEQAEGSGDAIQLALADTAVTPGTYGDATNVSQITVDQQGRLTSAANVAIVVTATDASDVSTIDANDSASRIVDQVMVGEDLALKELADGSGDAISLDVATVQTLDDGQGGTAQGFEMVVDGLGDFGLAIDSTGRPHLQGQNRFRYLNSMGKATNSSTTAVNNATITIISWDTEVFDTDTIHDTSSNTSQFVARLTGKYEIKCTLRYDGMANSTGNAHVGWRLNGSGASDLNLIAVPNVAGGAPILPASTIISLTAGDFIEFWAFQSNGATQNIQVADSFGAILYVGE